ncbi:MAG TPA: HDOD domain-containing protein [Acidimicrobiia bacterium]|nr:HDOD domain-containing protein [Acidimicrobiia bacterium]
MTVRSSPTTGTTARVAPHGAADELDSDQAEAERGALVDVLIEELERLPAQPSVAVRTVWVADQPNSSSKDLAAALTADPSLTARVLRLANSAYYGLSRRVADVAFAVTVVGFPTVRAMAAVHASGLFEPGEHTVPDGYWEHSVATATLCSALASRAGVRANQAFPLGLLHDLGSALLFRADPGRYEAVQAEARDGRSLRAAEKASYGMAHDEAAARVFAAWRFPETFIDAVADHHAHPATLTEPHALLLVAAESVASRLSRTAPYELEHGQNAGLRALNLDVTEALAIARQVEDDVAQLLHAFSS